MVVSTVKSRVQLGVLALSKTFRTHIHLRKRNMAFNKSTTKPRKTNNKSMLWLGNNTIGMGPGSDKTTMVATGRAIMHYALGSSLDIYVKTKDKQETL